MPKNVLIVEQNDPKTFECNLLAKTLDEWLKIQGGSGKRVGSLERVRTVNEALVRLKPDVDPPPIDLLIFISGNWKDEAERIAQEYPTIRVVFLTSIAYDHKGNAVLVHKNPMSPDVIGDIVRQIFGY